MPLPVTYHPLRTLRFHFLVASNCLSFLTVLPNETLTLTLTSERREKYRTKKAISNLLETWIIRKKYTRKRVYYSQESLLVQLSHNNQRTANPEKPLHMQLFKKKSESVSFLNMTTQKGNVVRLPQSYSYSDPRKGWKCTQKSSMLIESTESYHPLTGKKLCCHFPNLYSLVLGPGSCCHAQNNTPSCHRQLATLQIWYILVLLLWCKGK